MMADNKNKRGGLPKKWSRGQKRKDSDRDTKGSPTKLPLKVDENSPVIQAFRTFQVELDSRYDKYERLVKYSRDVTIQSKRIIFKLHRATDDSNTSEILAKVDNDLKQVRSSLLKAIAKELINEDFYYFLRAYTPGLQEYVEASSFYHFIKERSLITLQQLQQELIFEDQAEKEPESKQQPLVLVIPPLEYMLGLADLTGELMRRCINSVGLGNLEEPFIVCHFLQDMQNGFLSFGNLGGRELTRKANTLLQSLRKVENACYMIQVRGSEVPNHMLEDIFAEDECET